MPTKVTIVLLLYSIIGEDSTRSKEEDANLITSYSLSKLLLSRHLVSLRMR